MAHRDIQVHDFTGWKPRDVYDRTQTDDAIKDGDVLNLGNGNVAILVKAWPTIVVGDIEQFHRLKAGTSFETFDSGKYAASAEKAREASVCIGTSCYANDKSGELKNVLGNVAVGPFYIWANEDCANKSDSFSAAKTIRLALFNEGGESVHIVDADGVEVVDGEIQAHEALANAGYFAGARKPEVRPEFTGAFMVNDPLDPDGYAIVGDDIGALILEAVDHLNLAMQSGTEIAQA